MNNWISVKDKLPKEFQNVIVCNVDKKIQLGYLNTIEMWFVINPFFRKSQLVITHWQPLPKPP